MATTECRGALEPVIVPPCQRDRGQRGLSEFSWLRAGSAAAHVARDTGEPLEVAADGKGGSKAGTYENVARN